MVRKEVNSFRTSRLNYCWAEAGLLVTPENHWESQLIWKMVFLKLPLNSGTAIQIILETVTAQIDLIPDLNMHILFMYYFYVAQYTLNYLQ